MQYRAVVAGLNESGAVEACGPAGSVVLDEVFVCGENDGLNGTGRECVDDLVGGAEVADVVGVDLLGRYRVGFVVGCSRVRPAGWVYRTWRVSRSV
jgi:hypothetical protein